MNNNLLKIKELTKSFNKNSVLKKINMNVKKGEVIALIGSSGSGKSTLMNLITRTLEIEKGNILLDGKEISQYNNKSFYTRLSYSNMYNLLTELEFTLEYKEVIDVYVDNKTIQYVQDLAK